MQTRSFLSFSTDTIRSRVIDSFGVESKDVFDWSYSEGGYDALFFVFLQNSEIPDSKSVFMFDDEVNNFHRDDIDKKLSDYRAPNNNQEITFVGRVTGIGSLSLRLFMKNVKAKLVQAIESRYAVKESTEIPGFVAESSSREKKKAQNLMEIDDVIDLTCQSSSKSMVEAHHGLKLCTEIESAEGDEIDTRVVESDDFYDICGDEEKIPQKIDCNSECGTRILDYLEKWSADHKVEDVEDPELSKRSQLDQSSSFTQQSDDVMFQSESFVDSSQRKRRMAHEPKTTFASDAKPWLERMENRVKDNRVKPKIIPPHINNAINASLSSSKPVAKRPGTPNVASQPYISKFISEGTRLRQQRLTGRQPIRLEAPIPKSNLLSPSEISAARQVGKPPQKYEELPPGYKKCPKLAEGFKIPKKSKNNDSNAGGSVTIPCYISNDSQYTRTRRPNSAEMKALQVIDQNRMKRQEEEKATKEKSHVAEFIDGAAEVPDSTPQQENADVIDVDEVNFHNQQFDPNNNRLPKKRGLYTEEIVGPSSMKEARKRKFFTRPKL